MAACIASPFEQLLPDMPERKAKVEAAAVAPLVGQSPAKQVRRGRRRRRGRIRRRQHL